jgi:molybdate transport system permease protein
VPGGEAGAFRLSLVSVAVALGAVVISEVLTRRVGRSEHLT